MTAPGVAGAIPGFIGLALGAAFADNNNITSDLSQTPPNHTNPFAVRPISDVTLTVNGTGYTAAPTATISDPTGTGAIISPIWDSVNQVIVDLILVNGGENYTNPTVVFAGGGGGINAAGTATIGFTTGTWPGVVSYFQQRKWFGASTNYPQTLWATKVGQFNNMDVAIPVQDSDAITAGLVSNQVNAIKSLVSMPSGLLVFTNYGAWQVSGGGVGQPITPASINAVPQAYQGCNDVPPIVVNYDVLYVSYKGNNVRDIAYDFYRNIYAGTDISVFASHLFYGYTTVEWAYADAPFKLVWLVRSDGTLLCLTVMKEQEVAGWSQHSTDGSFTSVCSITENEEDAVYFVVTRNINGTNTQYVERLATRLLSSSINNAWFLDAALEYSGAAVATITGLEHLNGETVTAFCNGVVYSGLIVANRQVTLPAAVTHAVIGVPYTSKFQSLYLDLGEPTQQGKRKMVNSLTTRIVESYGLKVGPTFTELVSWNYSVLDFEGTGGNYLYTGDYFRNVSGGWDVPGQICIEQDDPYPLTVTGIIPEIEPGDTAR